MIDENFKDMLQSVEYNPTYQAIEISKENLNRLMEVGLINSITQALHKTNIVLNNLKVKNPKQFSDSRNVEFGDFLLRMEYWDPHEGTTRKWYFIKRWDLLDYEGLFKLQSEPNA